MDKKTALKEINKHTPCPHNSVDISLGDGTTWAKCEDCGKIFRQDWSDAIRKEHDLFCEAIEALSSESLTEVRIYTGPQDGSQEKIESYLSVAVPRVGDHICIQYWTAEVYRVQWTIINGKPCVDVFCDTSEIGSSSS